MATRAYKQRKIRPLGETKVCTKCRTEKKATLEFYYKASNQYAGLSPACKECGKATQRTYNMTHKEENKARCKKARITMGRTCDLRKAIDSQIYDALLNAQGGVCAICGGPPRKKRLAVDHNHDTGQNRGLLCPMCNHAIERFENDPDFGTKALNYLARYIEQTVKV